jgi:uncharacterized protein RhaS with RHS repeats
MGARYYDPVLGRFTSADNAAPMTDEPQDWNPYSYVQNNPMGNNDPTGNYLESAIDVASLAIGIAAITAWNAETSF